MFSCWKEKNNLVRKNYHTLPPVIKWSASQKTVQLITKIQVIYRNTGKNLRNTPRTVICSKYTLNSVQDGLFYKLVVLFKKIIESSTYFS